MNAGRRQGRVPTFRLDEGREQSRCSVGKYSQIDRRRLTCPIPCPPVARKNTKGQTREISGVKDVFFLNGHDGDKKNNRREHEQTHAKTLLGKADENIASLTETVASLRQQ